MRAYESVIGLEIHAQLLTKTKAFCPVSNTFGQEPNTMVGPVSGGLPGALPVLNARAVELGVRAGLALNCDINRRSVFSRKNYFYPDLPKGYQISQFDEPLCGRGQVDIFLESNKKAPKRIGITRIHLEEDAGKSVHAPSMTLVNLNRSGVPLAEIVSEPDLRSAEEAGAYLRKIHQILVYAQVCDGNLEEGNFRCDVNISIRPLGQKTLGTRAELKNINSFRFVEKAIEYEIARQISVVEAGGHIVQETRGWDSAANRTFTMRSKEEAHDYRYFPEPDLPPLLLTESFVTGVRNSMPELPEQKKARFISEQGLSPYDAELLTAGRELASYFEDVLRAGANAKLAANWIGSELLRNLKEFDGDLKRNPVTPVSLARLLSLIENNIISGKIAKTVFDDMFKTGGDPEAIVRDRGLIQVLDVDALDGWVNEILQKHPDQASQYRAGKVKVMGFFVGEVMKLSKGKANPPLVTERFIKKLTEGS